MHTIFSIQTLMLFLLIFPGLASATQPPMSPAEHPLLTANAVTYDQKAHTLDATGNVTVSYQKRWMKTDHLRHLQEKDLLILNNNLSLYEKNKAFLMGERAILSSDLRDGVIEKVHLYINGDQSTISGARAKRVQGRYGVIEQATYSPCKICSSKKPFWQLRSKKIVWDEEKGDISHHHAWLEMGGVPVFYTPYLHHPDPTVKRRAGLLNPGLTSSHDTGTIVSTPYFYPIDPHRDLTLTPSFGTKTQLLKTTYRHRFTKGYTNLTGSVAHTAQKKSTHPEKFRNQRWHIDGMSEYHINEAWRTKLLLNRASDPVYGKRFSQIDYIPVLSTTMVEAERFGNGDHLRVQMLSFQKTKSSEDAKKIPLALPYMQYNLWATPFTDKKILCHYNADFLTITRQKGSNMSRFTNQGNISRQWISSTGLVFNSHSSLQVDGYWSEKIDAKLATKKTASGAQGRVFPKTSLDVRLPFINRFDAGHALVSPVGKILFSPKSRKNREFPNEDAFVTELDDSNLLANNRILGKDRLDDGSRAVYGLQTSTTIHQTKAEMFAGQSYALSKPAKTLPQIGVDNRRSDYVLRGNLDVPEYMTFTAKARLKEKTTQIRRLELSSKIGPKVRHVTLSYAKASAQKQIFYEKAVEQLQVGFFSRITDTWSFSGKTIHNLRAKKKTLQQVLNLAYENECFGSTFTLDRSFFRDQDLKPGVTGMLRLSFTNLGNISHKRSLSSDSRPPRQPKELDDDTPVAP